MTSKLLTLAIVLVSWALGASASPAATPDHLRCYKVRDSAPRASYSADVSGLVPAETGCTIKVPGLLLCIDVTKANVRPTPPVGGSALAAGQFLCYKVKCPRAALPAIDWNDQFGARSVTPLMSRLICAPALPVATTSTTTTSIPSSPCVTETAPCTGACSTGVCGIHCGPGDLVCFSNGAGSCDTGVACTSDATCAPGKVCISSPGGACTEAFCCSPCP
jgi:hypothetical protein